MADESKNKMFAGEMSNDIGDTDDWPSIKVKFSPKKKLMVLMVRMLVKLVVKMTMIDDFHNFNKINNILVIEWWEHFHSYTNQEQNDNFQ